MLCVFAAKCFIEAQAWGANDEDTMKYGWLRMNGATVWRSSWYGEYPLNRGVNTFTIDTAACTVLESKNFDTWALTGAAALLNTYLQGLSDGTILVGVTADEASKYLDAAEAALSGLGADVSDVEYRGAWAFVAEIGDPSKTVFDKVLTEALALGKDPVVSATFTGA